MGLLELRATLNPVQFWPCGTADADTIKVVLQGKRAGFVYDGRPTRAFVHARIANKPVISSRGQVTVRLQGIDAPELHYRPTFLHRAADEQTRIGEWNRSFRQPLGEAAACALGDLLASISQEEVDCVVRSWVDHPGDVFDMYGRFIGDVFVRVGHTEINLNHWLAQHGWAYPAFYNSMRHEEINALRSLCREAKRAKRGVWTRAQPDLRAFRFQRVYRRWKGNDSTRPRDTGAVCMPKLFRRMAAWRVLDAAELPAGSFQAFLKSKPDACYETAEFLRAEKWERYNLNEVVTNAGMLRVEPGSLVFVEAPSSLRGMRNEVIDEW